MNEAAEKPSLTLTELSAITGVHRRALWRAVRAGRLQAFRARGTRHWRVWIEADTFQRLFESTDLQPETAEVNACHS